MSSNIPGFSHDVFISYRQKDNVPWAGNTKSEKVKGWVTEFVDALKAELKSTSGEDISIYFDGNLQEELSKDQSTDKSHRDQVKSVLFLPILSRTYCDPGSFPWRHELLGFLSHTVEDNVGLKEKLPQGIVSSRIVPVRIHDLPLDDLALFENETRGALHSIDFIFKGPGIHRHLLSSDRKEDNANHTSYAGQVSKVAYTICQMISSLSQQLKDKPSFQS